MGPLQVGQGFPESSHFLVDPADIAMVFGHAGVLRGIVLQLDLQRFLCIVQCLPQVAQLAVVDPHIAVNAIEIFGIRRRDLLKNRQRLFEVAIGVAVPAHLIVFDP